MFVLTVDQLGSRRGAGRDCVVRCLGRTVVEAVQAVLDDAGLTVDVALRLLRTESWSVGIGVGEVDEPLPASARAGSGAAFVLARAAVERAKSRSRPVALAVEGAVPERARDAESVLTLLGAVLARRSPAGWAVVDAFGTLGQEA